MAKAGSRPHQASLELPIGFGLAVCLAAVSLIPSIQAASACTAVIMCLLPDGAGSWRAALSRIQGVLLGCAVGTIAFLIHQASPDGLGGPLFPPIAGAGAACTLAACRAAGLPEMGGRVSCISFILTFLMGGADTGCGLERLLGTLAGSSIAITLALIHSGWHRLRSRHPAHRQYSRPRRWRWRRQIRSLD